MKERADQDPLAIYGIDDLLTLVSRVGFLPLFSNSIEGFSVEEHVVGTAWWTGDPATDPWEWRQILASHPNIAYGKFFNNAAGFVDKDFFPVLANYRRNGYDFDALFDDGMVSYRAKKIMDVFDLDEKACGKELMSYEIRELAGFGKDGGEKNFEGQLTHLQMQTYLLVSDFRQRVNRKGDLYGWHIAAVETPETKWGYDHIATGYSEAPEESWSRITGRVKAYFPDAQDAEIRKILGIQYPGTQSVTTRRPKEGKAVKQKTLRPQQLTWPENLITEIGLEAVFGADSYSPLNEDQLEGLEYALDLLKEKEKTAVILRYREHKTLKETGDYFALSTERIRQIIRKSIRKLRNSDRMVYYRDGYQGTKRKREERKLRIRESVEKNGLMKTLAEVDIRECELSVRAFNCLHRAGMDTLGQVVESMNRDPWEILRIRNLGIKCLEEVVNKLEEYGIDCDTLREEAKFFYGENNRVSKTLNNK